MTGWGSMSVQISIRPLNARERSVLVLPDQAERRCTLSLASRPGEDSLICRLDTAGGYDCPLVTSDGMPRLTNANATTDRHGVLTLDVPLQGTHPTPPLPWQRRYPHVDGFILPWTPSGKLRPGLRFVDSERGSCGFWVEHTVPRSAGRCVGPDSGIYEPCFPQGRRFQLGSLAACGGPGYRSFERFVITGLL